MPRRPTVINFLATHSVVRAWHLPEAERLGRHSMTAAQLLILKTLIRQAGSYGKVHQTRRLAGRSVGVLNSGPEIIIYVLSRGLARLSFIVSAHDVTASRYLPAASAAGVTSSRRDRKSGACTVGHVDIPMSVER